MPLDNPADSSSRDHRVSEESAPGPPRRSSRAPSSVAAATRSHRARPRKTRGPCQGLALELLGEPTHGARLVRGRPRRRRRLIADHQRHVQVLLVCVDPHVRGSVLHDRLPSMRRWRPHALTRELGGSGHRVECSKHHNVTMESRSFHIVWSWMWPWPVVLLAISGVPLCARPDRQACRTFSYRTDLKSPSP